ncbi:MAG: hypothetical protein IAG13_18610 [Deltaproteobacteria bacterium]|nr:hypothetical protein [Nannocystaceae bacterium]
MASAPVTPPAAKTPSVPVPVSDAVTPAVEPAIGTLPEVAIEALSASPYAATWAPKTAPAEAITFEPLLYAGVVGKAGSAWYHVDATGELVTLTTDPAPNAKIVGFWPGDAWMVQTRTREEDDFEYNEERLMKLRAGNRWVPQKYGMNEQWFHSGTGVDEFGRGEYDEAHMSTRSGMLMYPDTLTSITRVAGKHDDPMLGEHRGRLVDFFETGDGKIYLVTYEGGAYNVQTQCDEPECVATSTKKLPLGDWSFGRRVARGKRSISALASAAERRFVLHFDKTRDWSLDELPAEPLPSGMWNSDEGGLWILSGEQLRWRDTDDVWREVALPAGMTKPSVALSGDRKQVWIAGDVGGTPGVFTTPAQL